MTSRVRAEIDQQREGPLPERFVNCSFDVSLGDMQGADPVPFASVLAEIALCCVSQVLRTRQPLVVNQNMEAEARRFGSAALPGTQMDKSAVFVPLIAGEQVRGLIQLSNTHRENAFSESDVRLLQTLANSMSVALENARLFDETQRLLKQTEQCATELQIINNVGQTLTEGLDLDSTIERVGERLREVLNVQNMGIVAFDPNSELGISHYIYSNGKRVSAEGFSIGKVQIWHPPLCERWR